MRRNTWFSSVTTLVAASAFSVIVGCAGDSQEDEDDEIAAARNLKEHAACKLDDGTLDRLDSLRACAPGNTKKTTICHVPPGNPANAHTLCIGNAAVKHHLRNHPDYLGPCKVETPCPPPPVTPDAGVPGAGGAGGASGVGGSSGAGGTPAGGSGGAAPVAGSGGAAQSGGTGGIIVE